MIYCKIYNYRNKYVIVKKIVVNKNKKGVIKSLSWI